MSRTKLLWLLSILIVCAGQIWADPIVINLSVSDPFQTVSPLSTLTYHFTLENTSSIDLPMVQFTNLDPPSYLTEVVVPFDLPANETVTGTLTFDVAGNAAPGVTAFYFEAYSSLHDPVSGDSFASSFAPVSVNIVPEPSTIVLLTICLCALGFLRRHFALRLP